MMSFHPVRALAVVAFSTLFISAGDARAVGDPAAARNPRGTTTMRVAGSGVDDLNHAIVHGQTPTPTGMVHGPRSIVGATPMALAGFVTIDAPCSFCPFRSRRSLSRSQRSHHSRAR
jgi:hypothetical protein